MMKKLKNASGFTLAETLMTVLILLMVSTVVATGIPAAVNAYAKAVDAANAHALLSTTINALRDEFSTAWDMECGKKTGADASAQQTIVSYYSSDTGARTKLYIGKAKDTDTEETIMVQDYLAFDTDPFKDDAAVQNSSVNKPHTLVSTSAVTKNMKVSYKSVELIDNAVVVFKDLKVTSTKNNTDIAKIDELKIRLLSTNLVIPEAAPSGT